MSWAIALVWCIGIVTAGVTLSVLATCVVFWYLLRCIKEEGVR